MLDKLKNKLSRSQRQTFHDAFGKAHEWIDKAGIDGFENFSKSFRVRGLRDGSRVDIEVKKGSAFTGNVE